MTTTALAPKRRTDNRPCKGSWEGTLGSCTRKSSSNDPFSEVDLSPELSSDDPFAAKPKGGELLSKLTKKEIKNAEKFLEEDSTGWFGELIDPDHWTEKRLSDEISIIQSNIDTIQAIKDGKITPQLAEDWSLTPASKGGGWEESGTFIEIDDAGIDTWRAYKEEYDTALSVRQKLGLKRKGKASRKILDQLNAELNGKLYGNLDSPHNSDSVNAGAKPRRRLDNRPCKGSWNGTLGSCVRSKARKKGPNLRDEATRKKAIVDFIDSHWDETAAREWIRDTNEGMSKYIYKQLDDDFQGMKDIERWIKEGPDVAESAMETDTEGVQQELKDIKKSIELYRKYIKLAPHLTDDDIDEFAYKAEDEDEKYRKKPRTDDATPVKRILKWQGFEIGIQYLPFEKRHGRVLPAAYGHFRRTRGADGMAVDVYVGTNLASPLVFVVDQVIDGAFDEEKMIIGVNDAAEARMIYGQAMPKEFFGGMREIPLAELEEYRVPMLTKSDAKPRRRKKGCNDDCECEPCQKARKDALEKMLKDHIDKAPGKPCGKSFISAKRRCSKEKSKQTAAAIKARGGIEKLKQRQRDENELKRQVKRAKGQKARSKAEPIKAGSIESRRNEKHKIQQADIEKQLMSGTDFDGRVLSPRQGESMERESKRLSQVIGGTWTPYSPWAGTKLNGSDKQNKWAAELRDEELGLIKENTSRLKDVGISGLSKVDDSDIDAIQREAIGILRKKSARDLINSRNEPFYAVQKEAIKKYLYELQASGDNRLSPDLAQKISNKRKKDLKAKVSQNRKKTGL